MTVPLYVLAGGGSVRFGKDKARAVIDGQPLVSRVVTMLEPVASPATVVADIAGKYADLGLRTIADRTPGLGPIGGLDAAIHDRGEGQLLQASCDLVVAKPAWAEQLRQAAGGGGAAFRSDAGWEPLFAIYHTSIGPLVEARLSGADRSLQSVLDESGAVAVPLPVDWPALNQINTREDYRRVVDQPPI